MTAQPTKLSQALAQVVGETPDYRFHFLTELLKGPVDTDPEGRRLGRVKDLVVQLATPYPKVTGLLIDHGWGKPHGFLPWERVSRIVPPSVVVSLRPDDPPYRPYEDQPGRILLNEHLMGQTILDIDGRNTKVVRDLHLLESKGRMLLVHADLSSRGFLDRIGWGQARRKKEQLVSWRVFRPLTVEGAATDTVMLTVTRKQARYLPGDDLAAALEELKRQERAAAAGVSGPREGITVSTDYVAVADDISAGELLKSLRTATHHPDHVSCVFVTAPDHTLRGVVDLGALVLAADDAAVGTLMAPPAATVNASDGRSHVEAAFSRSGTRLLPVLDVQGRLVGVVSRSDFAR